jgi:hypothetical protein
MTLEQIAQQHLDADSWADEAMMLAALRAAVKECIKIALENDHDLDFAIDAIRQWAEGKP